VAVYVLVTVGSVPMAMLLFRNSNSFGPGLAAASPFWGTGYFSAMIGGTAGPQQFWPSTVAWSFIWLVVYTAVAAGLWAATRVTFDRCLGRVSEGTELAASERKLRKILVKDAYGDFA
jgi:hypothetical protein